jgi:putative endonuclease
VDSKELGREGEREAAEYLKAHRWQIIGQNVRVGRRELDLIARKGRILAFVEVKSRAHRIFGDPLEAITPRKQLEVARAAAGWLLGRALAPGTVVRFDAIGVLWSAQGAAEIKHIPDAWRMG